MGVETQPPSILERTGNFANDVARKLGNDIRLGLRTPENKFVAGIGAGAALLATTAADGPGKALLSCAVITGLFVLSGIIIVHLLDKLPPPPQDPPK